MPQYDFTHYSPPAPIALVTLQNQSNLITHNRVPMLMDTGADITLVPQWAIQAIGLLEDIEQGYELAGFNDEKSIAYPVTLNLIFEKRTFRGKFLVIDAHYGILGRNVLNAVPILLDAPNKEWRITR